MTTDLCVDQEALQTLADRLHTVRDELSRVHDDVGATDGRIGSSRVEDKLNDFVDGWKDGRDKIMKEIDALIDVLRGASETYTSTETNLIDAMQGNGGTGG